jgi:hypothetical protein
VTLPTALATANAAHWIAFRMSGGDCGQLPASRERKDMPAKLLGIRQGTLGKMNFHRR